MYKKVRAYSPFIRRGIQKLLIDNHSMLNKNLLFIHIPKAAGTSVSKAFQMKDPGHFSIADYKSFENKFKFSFVRDPWDRIASTYFYAQRHSKKYPYSSVSFINKYSSFDHFVNSWVSEENIKNHYFFRSSTDYLFIRGKNMMNFTGRFENLAADFSILSKQLDMNLHLPHENMSSVQDYKKLYTAHTRSIISSVYQDDIENFKYKF